MAILEIYEIHPTLPVKITEVGIWNSKKGFVFEEPRKWIRRSDLNVSKQFISEVTAGVRFEIGNFRSFCLVKPKLVSYVYILPNNNWLSVFDYDCHNWYNVSYFFCGLVVKTLDW